MTSDPSGSVSSIWMTESLPHSSQSNPVVGSCLPIVRKSSADTRKVPIGARSSQQKWSLISRYCRFAAGRSGHGSANGCADRDRIAAYLRSAIFPLLATARSGPRLAHFVAAARAPHYAELADTLDVDLDTAIGCMLSPFARSRAGSGAVNLSRTNLFRASCVWRDSCFVASSR